MTGRLYEAQRVGSTEAVPCLGTVRCFFFLLWSSLRALQTRCSASYYDIKQWRYLVGLAPRQSDLLGLSDDDLPLKSDLDISSYPT
jgi:hypothetical protein